MSPGGMKARNEDDWSYDPKSLALFNARLALLRAVTARRALFELFSDRRLPHVDQRYSQDHHLRTKAK